MFLVIPKYIKYIIYFRFFSIVDYFLKNHTLTIDFIYYLSNSHVKMLWIDIAMSYI